MMREVKTYKSFKGLDFYQGNENEYDLFPSILHMLRKMSTFL